MKKLNALTLAALAAFTFLASSCEKTSDSVAPVSATSKSADVSPAKRLGFYGGLAPVPVGAVYPNGSEATGIWNADGTRMDIPMRLISSSNTGVGEIDIYATDVVPFDLSTITPVYGYNYGPANPISAPAAPIKNTVPYDENTYVPVDAQGNPTGAAPVTVVQNCVTQVDIYGNVQMKVTVNLKK